LSKKSPQIKLYDAVKNGLSASFMIFKLGSVITIFQGTN